MRKLVQGSAMPIHISQGNLDVDNLPLDSITEAIETIDYPHHEVHSGSHFMYTDAV